MKILALALTLAFTTPAFAQFFGNDEADPAVVKTVNLQRYAGLWYEIGRFPTFFQKGCVRSTAKYTLQEDGVGVLNTCYREDGTTGTIEGVATAADPAVPAKLVVDFGFFRTGDYWITHLDPNYQWAVVSGPAKGSLFILARKAPMAPELLKRIVAQLKKDGFDTAKIIYDKYR